MGQRGPAPAPVALRVLRGEDHKARLARAPQPQDPPERPADLSKEAAAVWDRILDATSDTAHIGPSHANAFRLYCEVTAALNAMNPKGSKEWRELVLIHLRLARELCLTPATAGNLQARAKSTEKKLTKYIG